jgi:uncharacterized protein (DUF58 family)
MRRDGGQAAMRRGRERQAGPVTARGWGLAGAAALGLAAGFRLGYPELVVLGTAAALAVGCAIGYAAWRPTLAVHRIADPDRVSRGESCTISLTVRNARRLGAATLVAEDRCGSRAVPVPLIRLRPGHDTTVTYPVPTQRRGVVPIGPLRVTRRDPLGLTGVARGHGEPTRVWVYPRVHPLAAVPAGVARSLDGRVDRVPHGSITFDTLREYVVGDELRHVHWRTSARVGELMVREHLDTSLPRIVVLLDDRAASYPDRRDGVAESFESACEAAASVVAAAVREELPIALCLVGGGAVDSGGKRTGGTARAYLDLLAEATLRNGNEDLLATAARRLRQRPIGDTLVYLTGAAGGGDLGPVAALRAAYPSVIAGVFGAGTSAPTATTELVVIGARDGPDFAAEWDRSP